MREDLRKSKSMACMHKSQHHRRVSTGMAATEHSVVSCRTRHEILQKAGESDAGNALGTSLFLRGFQH